MTRHSYTTLLPLIFFLLSGCNNDQGGQRKPLAPAPVDEVLHIQIPTPYASNTKKTENEVLRCTAIPSPNIVNARSETPPPAEEIVNLTVSAEGGASPYQVDGYTASFQSSIVLWGTYTNSTNADLPVTRIVNVRDSEGNEGQCSFSLTVRPLSNSAGGFCALSGPDSPKVGESITYSVSSSTHYSWSSLDTGENTEVGLTSTSGTSAQSNAFSFSRQGEHVLTVKVYENGSEVGSCTKSVQVQAASNP